MFPPATPESVGLPSEAVLSLLERLEKEDHDPHSVIILRGGKSLAEGWWAPYRRERMHRLYSLSKSFTSTAIGLAVEEGRLGIDEKVLSFFSEEAPANPSENLQAMRVRDLLTMSCGQDSDDRKDMLAEGDGNWMRAFLKRPAPYAPGTHFLYNSSATYALSAILQRLTGETLLDYLRPRLLDPLGVGPARWESDPRGINVGGWGLYVTTDAIARFGQLLLQKGRWGDRQVVPEAWIEEATKAQVDNSSNENPDWKQGYGFQFWKGRHGFRGDGAFGQFCLVLPDRDLVVAITSASDDLQGVLDAVWEEFLARLTDNALPENPDAAEALRTRLANLASPFPEGTTKPKVVTVETEIGSLRVGMEDWLESATSPVPFADGPIASRGAFQPNGDLKIRVVAAEATESAWVTIEKGQPEARYQARGTWGARNGTFVIKEIYED